ncbi:glycosyltransferase family 2 protein [Synechococcus sp. MIT S9508]|uniref:glycosyltransferase family 2 protein n=1 Tax=Synechococcus sp. MIT S9508 TaxID=1801629 RepID=UPI0007BB0419|nr:glycosyltransferase family 2 protein [Synechococcus sp. MIT S9508]KZR90636.1 putative glycosyl transferase [Synechococcus sp. MIT S9508]
MKSGEAKFTVGLSIPTYDRKEELNRLLESLSHQSLLPDQIIIVDQNEPGFLDLVISEWADRLPIQHDVVPYKSASKARNHGAQKLTTEIIAFPDDDCVFTERTIELVKQTFFNNPSVDVIIGHKPNRQSKSSAHITKIKPITTILNLFNAKAETSNIFCRKELMLKMPTLFNECIGPGDQTTIISNEETDLLIRMLRENAQIGLCAEIQIEHHSSQVSFKRSLKYAEGRYELIRRQKLGLFYYLINLLQPLVRLAKHPSLEGLKYCVATMLGRSGITRLIHH